MLRIAILLHKRLRSPVLRIAQEFVSAPNSPTVPYMKIVLVKLENVHLYLMSAQVKVLKQTIILMAVVEV